MLKKVALKTFERLGGFCLARLFARKQPLIIMYHRIINKAMIPGIDPHVFEQQLLYLKKHFNVLNMKSYMAARQAKLLPDNCIVLTFDDGHKDFYTTAWPLLKKHQLSASLYIATGFVDRQCWLWPDLLRYTLITTTHTQLHHPLLGSLPLSDTQILKTWNTLGDYCLTLVANKRQDYILQLAQSLDVKPPQAPVEPFAAVSWENLREMQLEGLDIGSHSINHPILSSLTEAQLEVELTGSKVRIEQELDISPQGICYPNGMSKDTSPQVEQIARKFYEYGLVAYPVENSLHDHMHLGRIGASDNFFDFKAKVCHLTRNDNQLGEYR